MTLEEYALGHERYKDSFCYWLEWETTKLGSVRGGSSAKWGVWWSAKDKEWSYNERAFQSPYEALRTLMAGLTALLEAAAKDEFARLDEIGDRQLGSNRNSLRAKPLFLYFPDKFLPISNPAHLENILRYFGQKPKRGLHARNRQLLEHLRSLREFDGFHTMQMSRFLYSYKLNEGPVTFQNQKKLQETIEAFVRFANSPRYRSEEYDYKQLLLQDFDEALNRVLEGEAEPSVAHLSDVAKVKNEAGKNLTTWQEWDKLIKYLEQVPADEVQEQLAALLDDDGDIVERVDTFRRVVEEGFQKFLGKEGTFSLNLISLFLMGHSQNDHIIYRASIIDKACEDWGAPKATSGQRNDGTKYARYLNLIPPLRSLLTKSLNRSVDLIDVHSLLWFNFTDTYNEFKNGPVGSIETIEERPFMQQLLHIAQRTRNIILYGPPGTGKTYWVREFSRQFEGRSGFVTFHQSFGYEDFIEGWRPAKSDESGSLRYGIQDGIFKELCRRAGEDGEHNYLLVIDEINRANIAKVFGELITLIEDDKRLGMDNALSTLLPYSGKPFGVPKNLFLVGTMNTADRSIALLDIALRRRFTFVEVTPNPELLPTIEGIPLSIALQRLNERILALLDRDHQIGHSYFMDVENLADLRFAWEHRVVPLLQEYFYNDGERLQAIMGDAFVEPVQMSQESQDALGDVVDPDFNTFRLAELSDQAFVDALRRLAGVSPNPT